MGGFKKQFFYWGGGEGGREGVMKAQSNSSFLPSAATEPVDP